jgi:hypothetical protein
MTHSENAKKTCWCNNAAFILSILSNRGDGKHSFSSYHLASLTNDFLRHLLCKFERIAILSLSFYRRKGIFTIVEALDACQKMKFLRVEKITSVHAEII